MVGKVGKKLAEVGGCDESSDWEFQVIEAPKVMNAAAMPGGKVSTITTTTTTRGGGRSSRGGDGGGGDDGGYYE